MEKIKIRIIGCTDKNWWYHDRIGETFFTSEVSALGNCFVNPSGFCDLTIGIVKHGDYEVVKEVEYTRNTFFMFKFLYNFIITMYKNKNHEMQ